MADRIILRLAETEYRVELAGDGTARLENGEVIVPRRAVRAVAAGDTRWVFLDGNTFEFHVARSGRRPSARHAGSLSAPMPATVIRLAVAAGDRVRRGDTLVVVEAMKMELPIRAPSDARVTAVHCGEGDLVQPGVSLIDLED